MGGVAQDLVITLFQSLLRHSILPASELFDQPLVIEGTFPHGALAEAKKLTNRTTGGVLGSSNDEMLGDAWEESDFSSSSQLTLSRPKRAVGDSMDDIIINMNEVASETVAADEADMGDSWTFELVIDLPKISLEDKSDIKVELFGLDPDTGKIILEEIYS